MKHYFIDGTFYSPKNKAHAEASEFAAQYNHVVLDEIKMEELVETFKQKVAEINEKHKRCHDIVVSHWKSKLPTIESRHLGIEGTCSLNVVQVKRFDVSSGGLNPSVMFIDEMKEQ